MNHAPDLHQQVDVVLLVRAPTSGSTQPACGGAEVLRFTNHHPVSSSQLAVAATMLSGVYPPVHQIDDGSRSTTLTGVSVAELLSELGYASSLVSLSPRVADLGRCMQGFEAVHTVEPADLHGSRDEAVMSVVDRCINRSSLHGRAFFLMLWLSPEPGTASGAPGSDLINSVGHSLQRRTSGRPSLVIDLVLPAAAPSIFEAAAAAPLCILLPPGLAPASTFPVLSDCSDVAATIISAASDPSTVNRWQEGGGRGTSLVELPAMVAAPPRRLAYGQSLDQELGIRCRSVRSRSWFLRELQTLAGGNNRWRWQKQCRRLLAAIRSSREQRGQLLDLIRHGVSTRLQPIAEPDPAPETIDTAAVRQQLEEALHAWITDCERIKNQRAAAADQRSNALNSRLRALGYIRS